MGNELEKRSITNDMAARFGMEAKAFEATLAKTIIKDEQASREQVAAFLVVAKQYNLNPFTKEIYAFPARGGGIQPIVSIDGWLKIINNHKNFDGMEFVDEWKDDKLVSVTCRMYRKDRSHPIEVTEYMIECKRDTEPWRKYPARMLRHKATIQAARYAFSFSGIVDPDEAERIIEMGDAEIVTGQVSGDVLDMNAVNDAVELAKNIIDADDIETGAIILIERWGTLTSDERLKTREFLDDKAPDSRKKYKTLLGEYLDYAPEPV